MFLSGLPLRIDGFLCRLHTKNSHLHALIRAYSLEMVLVGDDFRTRLKPIPVNSLFSQAIVGCVSFFDY
jgi:hypothetical protein